MAIGETPITLVGTLTADPELRFVPSGAAVASFTIASNPRYFDKATQEYKEGEALFMRCSAWRDLAEHIAESLTRGTRVIARGRLGQRSYETREGEKRTVYEVQIDEIGPELRFATVQVNRITRGTTQAGPAGADTPLPDDPWGSAPVGSGGGFAEEPPFARALEPWERTGVFA